MIIERQHFEFLKIQRGDISNLLYDAAAWHEQYCRSLEYEFRDLEPFLPEVAHNCLDIGSGLGGIDVWIASWYKNHPFKVYLLDGVDDLPVHTHHDKTFNNIGVAWDFLQKNGVKSMEYYTPVDCAGPKKAPEKQFDIILSFRSYCFHYSPEEYLHFIKTGCHPDTILIFDVRNGKSEWSETLDDNFRFLATIANGKKCERRVYRGT